MPTSEFYLNPRFGCVLTPRLLAGVNGIPYAAIWLLPDGLSFCLEKEGRISTGAIYETGSRKTLIEVHGEAWSIHRQILDHLESLPRRLVRVAAEQRHYDENEEGPDPSVAYAEKVATAHRLISTGVVLLFPGLGQLMDADKWLEPTASDDPEPIPA